MAWRDDDNPNEPRARVTNKPDVGLDLTDTMDMLGDLQRGLAHSRRMVAALQEELDEARSREVQLDSRSDALAEAVGRLERQLAEARSDNERLMVDLVAADQTRREAAIEIRRLRDELAGARSTEADLREEVERHDLTLAELERRADARERALRERIDELERALSGRQERMNEQARELSRANIAVDELQREREETRNQIAHLEQLRDAFDKLRSSLKSAHEGALVSDTDDSDTFR